MALAVGALLALSVGVFATVLGLDRDRAFYATLMLVIAALYSLFAVMGSSTHALAVEALIGVLFIGITAAGFKGSLWLVVVALAGHGVFDIFHDSVVSNPGKPVWWPAFCSAYDIVAAGYLAWLLRSGRTRATN